MSEIPDKGFHFDEKKHAYYLDGKPLSGVTSVLGVIAKPALIQWAANMAVDYAKENAVVSDGDGENYYEITNSVLEEARKAHAKKRDKAADDGTDLHALVENWVRNCIETNDGYPRVYEESPIKEFTIWAIRENIRFLEAEKKLYSKELWLAGTVDLVFEKEGKRYVGDIKTYKKLWDRTPMLQCAAYGYMWSEMVGATPCHECEGVGSIHHIFGLLNRTCDICNGRGAISPDQPLIDGYCVIRMKDDDFEVRWSYDVEGDREAFLSALKLYRALQNWSA